MKSLKKILCLSALAVFSNQVVLASAVVANVPKTDAKSTQGKSSINDKSSGAEPLALKISGTLTAQAGGVSQVVNSNGKSGGVNFQVPTSDLYFRVYGKTSGGYKYGYVTRIQALASSFGVKRSYIEVSKDNFGVFEIGNVKGVDDKLGSYGAYNLLGGTGGINGSVRDYFNFSDGAIKGATIIGSPGIGTKVNYTSPTIQGFTFGISFTPNTTHTGKLGRDNTRSQSDDGDEGNEFNIYPNKKNYGYGINNVTLGLKYEGEYQAHRFGGDVVFITEAPRFTIKEQVLTQNTGAGAGTTDILTPLRDIYKLQKTNSVMFSLNYGYESVDLAASYLDNRKSRYYTKELEDINRGKNLLGGFPTAPLFPTEPEDGTPYVCEGNAGRAWNVGSSYKFGSYKAAIGYFNTSRKTHSYGSAKVDAVTATLDLKALEGLTFFGEVTGLKTKTNQHALKGGEAYVNATSKGGFDSVGNNKGAVFIVGTKVNF